HVLELLEKINTEICGNGRVLLRASGTENVIRIMVECESNALCDNYIKQLESVICEVENA
ncbi:MAG: phosphoglucosamine mutase, partial [Clostridia bacterium]|nr:phosphoglucosamine mutase [Clostridia bacterium]